MLSADPAFVSELKRIDKNLGCRWENGMERFVVTYKRPVGDAVPVMVVEDEDGSFKRPDRRDIDALCEGDLHRESPKDRMRRIAKYMDDYRESHMKSAADDIRHATLDSRRSLMSRFAKIDNSSKANATFRRIDHKPRGMVF